MSRTPNARAFRGRFILRCYACVMKKFLVAFTLFAAATPAWADQFQYNNLSDAVRAMQALDKAQSVKLFCAPCGDTSATTVTKRNTSIDRVWQNGNAYQSYWQVFLNGRAVDLAYVYVPVEGKWRNLALIVGAQPTQVPETIQ